LGRVERIRIAGLCVYVWTWWLVSRRPTTQTCDSLPCHSYSSVQTAIILINHHCLAGRPAVSACDHHARLAVNVSPAQPRLFGQPAHTTGISGAGCSQAKPRQARFLSEKKFFGPKPGGKTRSNERTVGAPRSRVQTVPTAGSPARFILHGTCRKRAPEAIFRCQRAEVRGRSGRG
jgi:hypothetical protein